MAVQSRSCWSSIREDLAHSMIRQVDVMVAGTKREISGSQDNNFLNHIDHIARADLTTSQLKVVAGRKHNPLIQEGTPRSGYRDSLLLCYKLILWFHPDQNPHLVLAFLLSSQKQILHPIWALKRDWSFCAKCMDSCKIMYLHMAIQSLMQWVAEYISVHLNITFLAQFGTMAAICHFDTSVTPGGGIHISSRSFILLFSILLPYHVGFESYKDIFRLQKLKAALRKQNLNLIKSNIKKKEKQCCTYSHSSNFV